MTRRAFTAAAVVLASGGTASAQTIVTTLIDDGTESGRSEMALRVSRTTRDVMAVWHHHPVSLQNKQVHYNASIDGREWRSDSGPVPLPTGWTELLGADPMVAFDHSGVGWVGYLGQNPNWGGPGLPANDRFILAPKPVGEEYADNAFAVIFEDQVADKGVLAAGPPMGGGSDLFGMTFSHKDSFLQPSWHLRSIPSPPGADYSINTGPSGGPSTGGSNALLILRNADGKVGRWIVGTYHAVSETVRPRAAWSPNGKSGGAHAGWFASENPLDVTVPGTSSREPIIWFNNPTPEGGPAVYNFPSLAADPRDESVVYMAFIGKAESSSDGDNIDIMIAQSTDAGENFSYDDPLDPRPGERVLRLRDVEDLGDPDGSIQAFPSITVDTWGTVHVLYYVAIAPEPQTEELWRYQVKLVSIEDFSIDPHPAAAVLNVFPEDPEEYFTLDHSLVHMDGGRRFLGHYMNTVDSRVCEVYAGYIARAPESVDGPRVYVSRILLDNRPDCEVDPTCYANCDGSTQQPILNVSDFTCFLQKFGAGCQSPTTGPGGVGPCYPNCDESITSPFLNVADFTCFLQRFAQGCA